MLVHPLRMPSLHGMYVQQTEATAEKEAQSRHWAVAGGPRDLARDWLVRCPVWPPLGGGFLVQSLAKSH